MRPWVRVLTRRSHGAQCTVPEAQVAAPPADSRLMDLLYLAAGLALLAFVGAASGVVAWNRSRRAADLQREVDATEELPPPTPLPLLAAPAPAHQAAGKAVIEQAQARAAELAAAIAEAPPVANVVPQFDGPAWAPTEPMPGMDVELQFADTAPAEMNFGAANFADTIPAELNFGTMNFADTLVTELATDERPGPVPGTPRRPA